MADILDLFIMDHHTDFMEGINYDDYCSCGLPLHEVITMPDGTKRNVAHAVNSKEHFEMLSSGGFKE